MGLIERPTQCDRLVEYLEDKGTITAYEAVRNLGILQLAARICELQKKGYRFKREKCRGLGYQGMEIRYIRYSLDYDAMCAGGDANG